MPAHLGTEWTFILSCLWPDALDCLSYLCLKKNQRGKAVNSKVWKKTRCWKNRVIQELSLNLIRLLVYSVLCKHEQIPLIFRKQILWNWLKQQTLLSFPIWKNVHCKVKGDQPVSLFSFTHWENPKVCTTPFVTCRKKHEHLKNSPQKTAPTNCQKILHAE